MFIDRVKIFIKGGNGGNGSVSFYRAKYITNGGPDGGDGGNGGSVIFVADQSLSTLIDFRYKKKYLAQSGEDGSKRNCSGKSGEDLIIKVPVGTIIKEEHSGKIMADFYTDGITKTIITGGKGGRGNQHFATSKMQAPKYAEQGKEAKSYDIVLELKLIADVGIIGLPNVGKSTLLSMVTNAKPKIDNYHFTTLAPNLGVVESHWGRDFVLADIPGLIEGASEGVGLGHNFLRHVERTKVLIHVVDVSGIEGTDPFKSIMTINEELEKYNKELLKRPQIIAANKMDIPESLENLKILKEKMINKNVKIIPISAATNSGLDELMMEVVNILNNYPEDIIFTEDFDEFHDVVIDQEPFTIEKTDSKCFVVEGKGIDKMLGYTSLETEKGFAFFQRYLREKGIIAKLEEMGIQEGDTVKLYYLEFDYYK